MHPTRDTLPLVNFYLVGGRVMPGVMRLALPSVPKILSEQFVLTPIELKSVY
jgi:hypothetical protein